MTHQYYWGPGKSSEVQDGTEAPPPTTQVVWPALARIERSCPSCSPR